MLTLVPSPCVRWTARRRANLINATNAIIGDATGVGTILNDDVKPWLSVKDPSVPEGNLFTTPLTFTVRLSPARGAPASVRWATRNDTALAGEDYVGGSGLLSFNAGETSEQITVLVNGDETKESDETFFVDLSQPAMP